MLTFENNGAKISNEYLYRITYVYVLMLINYQIKYYTNADDELTDNPPQHISVFTVDSLRKLCELVELFLQR
jgi:hypothetical protein